MTEHSTPHTLSKAERLSHQKRIDALFASRESFIAYPLRVVYIQHDATPEGNEPAVSILVSVSKKRFKRAVKRNRVKRLIKEAYRLNKGAFAQLASLNGTNFDIAFLYLKSELPEYAEIEKAVLKTVRTLTEKHKSTEDETTNP